MAHPVPPTNPNNRRTILVVCLALAVITLAVFAQTVRFEFLNYDDDAYVYNNSTVTNGLTLPGINSAFTQSVYDNWVPLTTLSHMVDYQIYGLNAGGHHLTNILLHTASVILLFLVLQMMTGMVWRSAFVAAIFAVHPLHVESVAWVSERKDTLSGLFFMLTLLAYVHYVRRPNSLPRYLLVVSLFAFGLLSKPMLVTLPFILLLLDYWPLNRFAPAAAPTAVAGSMGWLNKLPVPVRLILEKIPLLLLVLGCSIMTTLAEKNSIQAETIFPLPLRFENAMISYVTFLWQMFYPSGLAPYYPFQTGGFPLWKISGAFLVLAAISAAVFLWRQKRPYLLVGWLWYLGMLVPVVGIFVQEGGQARADRHTYLPLIGLGLMLAWLAVDVSAGWRQCRQLLSGLASVAIGGLMTVAWIQTAYWKNDEVLWTRTLSVTSNNALAHNNLGNDFTQKGRMDKAIIEYRQSLAINPDFAQACYNLGYALAQKGQVDESIIEYQKALAIDPNFAQAHNNLGGALAQKGQMDAAITQFQKALTIDPNNAQACYNLGDALARKGQVDEAISQFQHALAINPNYADAYYDLGLVQFKNGQVDEAIIAYQKALAISPNNAQVCYQLGDALLKKGQANEAIGQFQNALGINPNYANAHCGLGNALQLKGRMSEAIRHYREAVQIDPNYIEALNNLAWILATCPNAKLRNGDEAVGYGNRACTLTHYLEPMPIGTLAAAYAQAGRIPDAIAAAEKAEALATKEGLTALAEKNQELLKLYRAGQAYHQDQ